MVHLNSPIRWKKISQGRLVWDTFDEHMTYNEKLHELFKYRYGHDDGYSNYELTFIMDLRDPDIDRKIQRTKVFKIKNLTAQQRLDIIQANSRNSVRLTNFRKWLENESIILANVSNVDNELAYFNLQTKPQVNSSVRKKRRLSEGLESAASREIELYAKGRKVRARKAEQVSSEISLRIQRINKRKRGDFGVA